MIDQVTTTFVKALVALCVLFALAWGYQRIGTLNDELVEANRSLSELRESMATQKQLDALRLSVDSNVRRVERELNETNTLARRLFDETQHTTLNPAVVDGLHKGCDSLGVPCISK